jgi:hypothetical protein
MTIPSKRSALVHFALASTKPKKQEKRNERFAERNESFRMPDRKSLKSLSALNQSFRGIVCFQWVNGHFISRFFDISLSCPRKRASSHAFAPTWIPACARMTRRLARISAERALRNRLDIEPQL